MYTPQPQGQMMAPQVITFANKSETIPFLSLRVAIGFAKLQSLAHIPFP